jgi:FKBP-type peptidyl-prolyl cis-trans isomerase
MTSGIKVVLETEGSGVIAEKGDRVTFECDSSLNQGTEIHPHRIENTVLGTRRFIAGVESALIGMREGGYRKVRISPHLAYGEAGIQDKVPANAVVIYQLWLKQVEKLGPTINSTATARKRAAR